MLNNNEPKNGDYVSYLKALEKQALLFPPAQEMEEFQPSSENTAKEWVSAAESTHKPLRQNPSHKNNNKPLPYTVNQQKTETEADQPAAPQKNILSFGKTIRTIIVLFFLFFVLGPIILTEEGDGSFIIIIIAVIALARLMTAIFSSKNTNRKK